jgi:hypothetical protein
MCEVYGVHDREYRSHRSYLPLIRGVHNIVFTHAKTADEENLLLESGLSTFVSITEKSGKFREGPQKGHCRFGKYLEEYICQPE